MILAGPLRTPWIGIGAGGVPLPVLLKEPAVLLVNFVMVIFLSFFKADCP